MWPQFSNEPLALHPQAALFAVNAGRFARNADVLAGEAGADGINLDSIGSKASCGELSHVVVADDIGPVLAQDSPAESVSLAEGNGSHPGSLKSETKSSDAAEEVEDIQLRPSPLSGGT
jgi:hypothetical protein